VSKVCDISTVSDTFSYEVSEACASAVQETLLQDVEKYPYLLI